MVALWNRAYHYIFVLWFLLSSSSFFLSSTNVRRRTLNVCITSTHGVALVRISDAGLKHAAHGSLQIQDPKNHQNSPSVHHRTTLSGYIFAIKARIDNRKKNLLSSNVSPHVPTIWWTWPTSGLALLASLGHRAHFNGFCVLAVLLHVTLVVGISQNLRRWTEGVTYIWQGGHHIGHRPTFLVGHVTLKPIFGFLLSGISHLVTWWINDIQMMNCSVVSVGSWLDTFC